MALVNSARENSKMRLTRGLPVLAALALVVALMLAAPSLAPAAKRHYVVSSLKQINPKVVKALTKRMRPGAIGPTGGAGETGAKGLTWRGAWKPATAYATGDAVESKGSSYVAVKGMSALEDSEPPEPLHWELFAKEGAKGVTGATGAEGKTGTTGAEGKE